MGQRCIFELAYRRSVGGFTASQRAQTRRRRNSVALARAARHVVGVSLAGGVSRLKSGCTAIDATGRGAQNWRDSAAIIGSLEYQVGLAPALCYWEI
jgi:hypothetical protein